MNLSISRLKICEIKWWHWLSNLLLVQILAACSQVSSSPPATKVSGESKDEIVLAFSWEDFDDKGFDPTMGWNYYGPPLFQSTLLRRNEDLELVNDLAQNYTISSDRKIWTFKIREDVRFSDDQPLTAEDVAYTFNQTKESGGLVDLSALDKAVVKGNYEVELHLKQPRITFINQIANLGIVPKHAHNKNYFRNPIGSGPYRLVQWNPGEQIIAEANPYYYGTPANIKRLVILLTLEDASLAAAKAGRVDVAHIPPSLAIQQITGMNLYAHKSDGHAGLMLPYIPNTGTREKLIEILHSNYALFAYAQGETTTGVVLHHGLRNVALPAITLQFASLGELFDGSVLIEKVFNYPGLGDATVQAALRSDVPLLLGIVFFSATFVFIGNTLADLSYQIIDPRIRFGKSA
ncbi:extracellular solute-binding protein, family 5 [Fischerella sp. NIES-3754]|nr:extracellular solute-binding protein, family 5 [Fischerella sp. NIES-3754]BCX10773.1 MAG: hypothetical protein KatS3mg066_4632 [Fischerella sp.]